MNKLQTLMTTPICDLKLNLQKSHLYPRILELYDELSERGLKFRPECYFADEWFVPEGETVIGIPFYLGDKNLMEMERRMIGEVEGETYPYFMKLLRHECGHAISYAFKLHKNRSYVKMFGPTSKLFTDIYRFNARSKKYVKNLKDYYAQSHPDEDFAETFAVWLSMEKSGWKKAYKGWGALKKLEYVDDIMTGIKNKKRLVKSGLKMCHVKTLKYTLWTYYMRRRSFLAHNQGPRP